MWSNGRVAGIQLLVWSCGTIIGWQKFVRPSSRCLCSHLVDLRNRQYTAETPDEVFDFLSAITPPNNSSQSPTHIAYDRSCTLLRHVLRSPSHQRWSPLQGGPQFIVDAWHFAGHSKNDRVCRECCDPDQGQDLVVPFVEKRARKRWERGGKKEAEVPERRWKRCFNTEVCFVLRVSSSFACSLTDCDFVRFAGRRTTQRVAQRVCTAAQEHDSGKSRLFVELVVASTV